MNKLLVFLAVTNLLAAATQAVAAEVSNDTETTTKQYDNGDMKSETKSESTDAAGLTRKSDTEVRKDVNSNGSTDTVVTKEKSTDPKGLFNKTSIKTTDETKTNAKTRTVKRKHKKIVNGSTVENSTSTQSPILQ